MDHHALATAPVSSLLRPRNYSRAHARVTTLGLAHSNFRTASYLSIRGVTKPYLTNITQLISIAPFIPKFIPFICLSRIFLRPALEA